MNQLPDITVSSVDMQRLEALIAGRPGAETAALQNELDRADIVAPAQLPPDVVSMNSVVRFEIEESGESFTRTLVYPRDAGNADTVSILAPVGSALLGLSLGAAIAWPLPNGKWQHVRIVEIAYQPERSGFDLQ